MFEHILVPVDLSHDNPAHEALAVARTNLAPGGKLTLLHVIAPIPGYVAVELGASFPAHASESARNELAEVVKRETLPADTELRVEHGSASRTILDSVTSPDKQAIVMESHNPKFGDFLIGSVAAHVVKHAKCSVFVIRHRS